MSTTTDTPAPADTTAATDIPVDAAPADNAAPADTGSDDRAGNKEARYRVERNEARAERDALGERLTTLQRREAERLAGQHLAAGNDLWRDGLELASLVDENGDLDASKVTQAAKTVLTAHPHWAVTPSFPNPPRTGVLMSGATGSDGLVTSASWTEVLNPRAGN